MLRIAICDDDKSCCDEIVFLLREYASKHDIYDIKEDCYYAPIDLEQAIEHGKEYDIFLLDIYMPGITGISVAQEFRKNGITAPIIFLTASRDHAIEAFGVNATQYILKPIEKESFFSAMKLAVEKLAATPQRPLMLKISGNYHIVEVHKIIYAESRDKKQEIHLTDGTKLTVRMTGAELYNLLCRVPGFVRCGISHILNIAFIQTMNTKDVKMKNGTVIKIPRGSYASLKDSYYSYFYERE